MSDKKVIMTSEQGETFSGYLATKLDQAPGIVLIQEIFGVNKTMRSIANRFAEEGYSVLVPDLFWRIKPNIELGYEGKDLEKAFDCYHSFDLHQGVIDINTAIQFLKNQEICSGKIAVLGFCLGGKLAYLTAVNYHVDAAVAFYGGGIAEHLKEAKKLSCPLLMHFGEKDEMIPADQVDSIREAFKHRNDVEIYTYPDVGHAFYNHDRNTYNAEAANLAHQRTIEFLQHTLETA